jgi:hypothetical protein
MDNVQKHNICTNVPSSENFTSYKPKVLVIFVVNIRVPKNLIVYV